MKTGPLNPKEAYSFNTTSAWAGTPLVAVTITRRTSHFSFPSTEVWCRLLGTCIAGGF
jgi:hypothetical protein